MKASEAKQWIYPALIIGGVYVGWEFGFSPLFETLGLKNTAAEAASERLATKYVNAPINKDFWRPAYITTPPKGFDLVQLLTATTKTALAKKIYNAISYNPFSGGDDEEAIYAAFRALNHKSQVADLAGEFKKLYGKDLYYFLAPNAGYLNLSEMGKVLAIVEKLPWGFKNSKTGYAI